MGAWGYGPMDNDEALEWVANDIEVPLIRAIEKALTDYVHPHSNRNEEDEEEPGTSLQARVEAAVAVLVDYSAGGISMPYSGLHIGSLRVTRELWELATVAMEMLLADRVWLDEWEPSTLKREHVTDMLTEVKRRLTEHTDSG